MGSILNIIKQNKTLLANFSYLSVLQVFNLLAPLITYPYLLRVIGGQLYGNVIFAQTIVSYIILIINFGFNISGTRYISQNRSDVKKISEVYSAIFISKSLIWVISLIIYFFLVFLLAPLAFRQLYYFSYFLTFSELLFPYWYFQGIEKMKYITVINLLMRLIFIGLIFIVINEPMDYIYIPLLNSFGGLLGGILAVYIVLCKENVAFVWVKPSKICYYVRDAFPIFISIMSTQFYLNLNKLIVGICLGMSEVTVYDLGEKVITLLKAPINVINQAIFPKISLEKNLSFLNKVMWIVVGIAILMYIVVFYGSTYISMFFIKNNDGANIIKILSFSIILFAFTSFLGGNRLLPWGFQKEYMKIMIANCSFYIFVMFILYLSNSINLYSISIVSVLVEVFCLLYLLIIDGKFNILTGKKLFHEKA